MKRVTTGVVPKMRLLASPVTGVLRWVRDYAGENAVALLGDIAAPAVQVPADMKTAHVDELFRNDPQLHHVIVQSPTGPALLDRSWFESMITGRLGYGRLLHARRPILAIAPPETVVLAHDCTIEAAASAVISRRTSGRAALATVVTWPDGVLKVALISTIFERLARQYAYQSWHDPLTRLPNRGYFASSCEPSTLDRSAKSLGRPCSSVSTSTGSRRSTTPSGTLRAMRCLFRSRPGRAPCPAGMTSWCASAAMSLPC